MATVRQYDGDNAIERWRHCDDTTATVRYDYRIVAPRDIQDIRKLTIRRLPFIFRRYKRKAPECYTTMSD
ncbi:hypothetical protein DPMN_052153 [Dreissena polymorpha]|uniref:Uncharacterized protein n=1 Tax=Dreissena polymorpha TaxID=45954 RepID=A0A9D4HPM2_DREPO|nr:hypothetical protein DPMN_052153 [Dreissena polymorpha]